MGNYARALDLYLALENAFDYYGENLSDNRLLTKTQKYQVLLDLDQASQALDNYLYSLVDFGGIGNPAGVRFYEAEPGNRPMKMFLTMGYAALTMQNYASSNAFFTENREKDYLQKAFRSAGLQEESNSIKYWSYQTHNGKRFWAEGAYYFEFTMNDVIPFWHAIRINNMLNWNGNNISDPFSHSWFLNPLDWLADLSTPNGYLPPLDDGNKSKIDYANLLRWNSTYATSAQGTNVGKKFAWIGDKIKSSGESLDSHTLLVQLSMPHVSVGSGSPPKELVKNPISYVPGDGAEQQLILRRPDANGNTNYILLNGESGTAISRGEGHEQADQLQLLYYKNGKSYLMDSGYDRAGSTTNSTWNQYDLHNVIGVMNAQGNHGLPSPNFEPLRGRKVAHHNSVTNLYQERVGNLDILNGRLVINNYSFLGEEYNSFIKRKVIFIGNDAVNGVDSYIIDTNLNQRPYLSQANIQLHKVFMNYFSDSTLLDHSYDSWSKLEFGSEDLFIFWEPVEYRQNEPDTDYEIARAREVQGRDRGPELGYAVSKISRGPVYSLTSRSFNFVAFINVSESRPSYQPQKLFYYDHSNTSRSIQAWVLTQNTNTIDVFVQKAHPSGGSSSSLEIFDVPQADNYKLKILDNVDTGFARLIKGANGWEIDSNYQLNIDRAYPPPSPLVDVTISGSSTIGAQQSGTWAASVNGGTYPLQYHWKYMYSGCMSTNGFSINAITPPGGGGGSSCTEEGIWQSGDSDQNFTLTYNSEYSEVYVKVTVTDQTNSTVSDEKRVLFSSNTSYALSADKMANSETLDEGPKIPNEFELSSNYPNPFNPSTNIRYGIPEASEVNLEVYDMLGRRVATLVHGNQKVGYHQVVFNANSLAGGIYLGRLIVTGTSGKRWQKTIKMNLIK